MATVIQPEDSPPPDADAEEGSELSKAEFHEVPWEWVQEGVRKLVVAAVFVVLASVWLLGVIGVDNDAWLTTVVCGAVGMGLAGLVCH